MAQAPLNITIRDAAKFRTALVFARGQGLEEEFVLKFGRFLSLLACFMPEEIPDDTARVMCEVGMDFVPHSFTGYVADQLKEGGFRTRLTAGLIRHQVGIETDPSYEWNIHT